MLSKCKNFKEGSIYRIFCQDFLTYNSIEWYPCPDLNMVTGPNGTGKSSLVNAIVLGLGGKINVIGRAKQLSAYVKRGCKTAIIEIELYSEPRNYIIKRTFNTENKNSWSVNGETVTHKQVEAITQRLNIQVDNLCQFLPQDRVQDFAKMDSKQLLESTLKTVGSQELVDLHTSLKAMREKEANLDTDFKVKKQELDSLTKKAARLETEVKAIQERDEMMNTLKMLEKKKGWVEYEEKEKQIQGINEDKAKLMDMKVKAEQHLAPFEREIKEAKEAIKKIDRDMNKEIKICGDTATAMRRKFEAIDTTDDHIHSLENELKRKIESEKRRAYKIKALEEEIFKLESNVNSARESKIVEQMTKLQPQLASKTTEVSNLLVKIGELEDNMAEVVRNKTRSEGALAREMSAGNVKRQVLAQKFRDAYKAYEWVQQNRHQFRGQIYGPLMLEINCNEEVAKFVEKAIPQADLIAFMCEDKDDMNKLLRTVRDSMGLRINVVQATRNCNNPVKHNFHPNIPIENLKKFGFWSYIIDQIEGCDPVMNYLCHNHRLHLIPLGNQETSLMADQIPEEIRSYFSDRQHFSVRTSRYSGERSTSIMNVKSSTLLAGSINKALITEYNISIENETKKLKELKESCDSAKKQLTSLEQERDNLRTQKRILDEEVRSLRTMRSKMNMKKEELDVIVKEGAFDLEAEKAKTKLEIKKSVIALCNNQKNVSDHLKQYQDSLKKNDLTKLKLSVLQKVLRTKQQESMAATKQLEDCKRMVANVEDELIAAQRERKKVRECALKLTDGLSPKDSAFKKKFQPAFTSLPDDLPALDAEISRLNARADCLVGGRSSVLEEYDKIKKKIANLQGAVAHPERQLQALRDEMERQRSRWMPQVLELIGRINENFTNFFSTMKCVGEVSLEEPENKDEYSKYGICIKVQFRESGKLQKLGPHTQSGGERAVSTAVYMMSLQELTTVPFRCVDEINQGMDEHNERMVFKMMVSTIEKKNSTQCFLLSPKLLHMLDYTEKTRIHCIYSGVNGVSHQELNLSKYAEIFIRRNMRKRNHPDSDDSD